MGCGAGKERALDEHEIAAIKSDRFAPFPDIPDAHLSSNGIHADAVKVESKGGLLDQIMTTSGTILTHCNTDELVECLFFYPEVSATEGKKPCDAVKLGEKMRFPGRRPTKVDWMGIRCQFKEFDSYDDVVKGWHEDGDEIPGVHLVEPAGPNGAWATLSPHIYQQRYILPDGGRTACFADDALSLPQRVHRAWKHCGGDTWVRLMAKAVNRALQTDSAKMVLKAIDQGVRQMDNPTIEEIHARFPLFHVEEIVESFCREMDRMGDMRTVRQLHPDLGRFIDYLAFLEDAMLYNWLEVGVEVEVAVGTYCYRKSDDPKRAYVRPTIADVMLRKTLQVAEDAADETFEMLKDKTREVAQKLVAYTFDGFGRSTGVGETLFPDLVSMVNMDLASIDMELIGLIESIPEPAQYTEAELDQQLQEWREEDALPVEERRKRCYQSTLAKYTKLFAEAQALPTEEEQLKRRFEIGQMSRWPEIIPKRFRSFSFFLMFPIKPLTGSVMDFRDIKRPKVAELHIWPENHPEKVQVVRMTDVFLPDGGDGRANVVINSAVDTVDTGDDHLDEPDDPRWKWEEYPSRDWRGFMGEAEVAMGLNYSFNFYLDEVLFLDHNSFFSKAATIDRVFYRRVRFYERARPFTCNPLTILGLQL